MPLALPKLATLNPSMAYAVGQTLMTTVAWRSAALTTYQFYEEIDRWLGPWGASGYPIGYGKKYNIAFNTDPILNSPYFPVANAWVHQTTINLQVALVDVIVAAIRDNKLYRIIQEDQLRKAAFDAHPGAYLRGGLMRVAEQEPECIPVIVAIAWEQFNPLNPNFSMTFGQVVEVIREPGIRRWLQAAIAGSTHLPSEARRLLYEEARNAVQAAGDAARETIERTERLLVSETKRALLRRFAELTERYQPLRRYFY